MEAFLGGHATVPGAAAESGKAWAVRRCSVPGALQAAAHSAFGVCISHRSSDRAEVSVPGGPQGLGSAQADLWITTRGPGASSHAQWGLLRLREMLHQPQLCPVNAPGTEPLNLSGWLPLTQQQSPLPGPLRASLRLPAPCPAQSLVFRRCPEGWAMERAV